MPKCLPRQLVEKFITLLNSEFVHVGPEPWDATTSANLGSYDFELVIWEN